MNLTPFNTSVDLSTVLTYANYGAGGGAALTTVQYNQGNWLPVFSFDTTPLNNSQNPNFLLSNIGYTLPYSNSTTPTLYTPDITYEIDPGTNPNNPNSKIVSLSYQQNGNTIKFSNPNGMGTSGNTFSYTNVEVISNSDDKILYQASSATPISSDHEIALAPYTGEGAVGAVFNQKDTTKSIASDKNTTLGKPAVVGGKLTVVDTDKDYINTNPVVQQKVESIFAE